MSDLEAIVEELKQLAKAAEDLVALQQTTVQAIAHKLPRYDWVGFYMLDPSDPSMLVLGPFHGAPTPHVRIPVTKGICGAAVAQNKTIIVQDVASDPRYLACSIATKAEIVTPIRAHGRVVGEIDVDSHTLNAFHTEDQEFMEKCADIIGKYIERSETSSLP